jgi:hypothetical protein
LIAFPSVSSLFCSLFLSVVFFISSSIGLLLSFIRWKKGNLIPFHIYLHPQKSPHCTYFNRN